MVRLISRLDLPLAFDELEAFDYYITTAHSPRFTPCSRQTTTRNLTKYFAERRDKLMDTLKHVSSVALTSDIWSGNAKDDYLPVVAHFINSDWQLEKRILGMRLIDCSHNAENIAERVACVASGYGISDKIFSITLDNASANTKSMGKLTPLLSGYVGSLLLHSETCLQYH